MIADAQVKLRANDPAAAVVILEQIVAKEPGHVVAWRLLATALQRSKAYDRAIAAFQQVLVLQPDATQMLYNVGATHALAGNAAKAFEWLDRAKATRRLDMSQIDVDQNLVSLRGHPRFAALRPVKADFADPFVEPVKILRQLDGEAANDQFGWIARSAGDVDGDRVLDIVTSAPTKDVKGANAGRIYVYSAKSGKLLWTADGAPGDRLGTGLEHAGDTNRDGVPDVVAGAPGGAYARVFSGRDGRVLLTVHAEATSDAFGNHVSTVGDVNDDGHADLIVGAPGNNSGGTRAGRAYVYSGKDGSVLLTLTGERAGDGFGSTVAGQTALRQGDGRPQGDGKTTLLIVGAPSAGPNALGRTYVYKDLSTKPAFVIEADETGNALGAMFVSAPGDVDGDSVPDVYASDFSNAARGPSTGRIYVHSGRDGRRILTLTGETAGEGFGTSPSVAGDVDGDGHADLIVGAWQYGGAAVSGGRAYLHSGRDGRVIKTFTCRTPGDALGFDAVGLGDTDGDGTIDLLLTSAWSGINGYHSGRLFVVSSGVTPTRR